MEILALMMELPYLKIHSLKLKLPLLRARGLPASLPYTAYRRLFALSRPKRAARRFTFFNNGAILK